MSELSIVVKKTSMDTKISEQQWLPKENFFSPIVHTGITGLTGFSYLFDFFRHMADRLGTPYLQKVLNQVNNLLLIKEYL